MGIPVKTLDLQGFAASVAVNINKVIHRNSLDDL
jgi:hypothetical protein